MLASFSGAEVLTCTVKNLAGKALPGTWSFVRQQFTPDERLPTVDNTWTLSITVAHGNAEDVNTHFIDEVPALPEPSGWRYTGSWDASDSYTEGWGPEWGADPHPASLHPSVYSIRGSNNTGAHGTLAILAAKARGWVLVSFSGAQVLDVHVQCGCPMSESPALASASTRTPTRAQASWKMSDALVEAAGCPATPGKWSVEEQEWTPDHRAPTVDATCTVDVTVATGNLEDVNAHFIDKPGVTPQPEDRHAPPPPPDDWDHSADAEDEEPGGGAAPPQSVCKGNWRWTGSWDGSDSYTRGWGPEWGDDENPPSHHPLYHSIHGSNNTGTVGHLSVTSGVNRGWIKASFSGSEVLSCSVANYDGSRKLAGSWNLVTQQWTPAKRGPTVGAQWFMTITVAPHTCEDVNVHFIDEVREDSWRYTGSWDDPAAPSYTHEWGPAWGKDEQPASKHPEVYSIKGSDNVGGSGALS